MGACDACFQFSGRRRGDRQATAQFTLTFNEPVSPLVLRLVAPDGSIETLRSLAASGRVAFDTSTGELARWHACSELARGVPRWPSGRGCGGVFDRGAERRAETDCCRDEQSGRGRSLARQSHQLHFARGRHRWQLLPRVDRGGACAKRPSDRHRVHYRACRDADDGRAARCGRTRRAVARPRAESHLAKRTWDVLRPDRSRDGIRTVRRAVRSSGKLAAHRARLVSVRALRLWACGGTQRPREPRVAAVAHPPGGRHSRDDCCLLDWFACPFGRRNARPGEWCRDARRLFALRAVADRRADRERRYHRRDPGRSGRVSC